MAASAGDADSSGAMSETVELHAGVLLARAEELVRRGWCRGALARDPDGRVVEPWSESARAWSPLGALLKVWLEQDSAGGNETFREAYTALALATGGRLEEWNSARWRTRSHVERAFLRARHAAAHTQRRSGDAGGAPSRRAA